MNTVERFRKYRRGGLIHKFQEGGTPSVTPDWSSLASVINRYNPQNDHYLNEILTEGRNLGFSDLQIAVMMANAIHENQGSPLATKNGRVGLWQGDKRQAAYLGNTVSSNLKAFKADYDYGKWYSDYSKNGWNPKYYKQFRDGTTIEDVNHGMTAGYERFNGSNNRNNSEVKARAITSQVIYDILNQK